MNLKACVPNRKIPGEGYRGPSSRFSGKKDIQLLFTDLDMRKEIFIQKFTFYGLFTKTRDCGEILLCAVKNYDRKKALFVSLCNMMLGI